MSGERSNLIDITYERLYSWLNGQFEHVKPSELDSHLKPRIPSIRNIAHPFGTPSDASRQRVNSGSITLEDEVTFKVEEVDKEVVFAISDKFSIDQVQAFILLRSFLYNASSTMYAETLGSNTVAVDELVEIITPFYYSQRLFVLRILPPLFRAMASDRDPLFTTAQNILPEIIPDGRAFAEALIDEYARKCTLDVPKNLARDPRKATRWAKQNYKEQLVMLELLFWTVWDYAPCDGPLVSRILELAYELNLGSNQQNATLLLDPESMQLQQDCAALWILITIEVLELEKLAEPGATLEISATPENTDFYVSDPQSLLKIHQLITSHPSSQFAIGFLAWAFVLSRIVASVLTLKEIPDTYRPFFDTIHLSPSASGSSSSREPVHVLMTMTCLQPEVGLFQLMLNLLTTSPLYVSSIAIKTGSSIITPNVVASRSVFKGLIIALFELVPLERVADFDTLVEVWLALFGRSEASVIRGISRQFWEYDLLVSRNRRAILDVARARFPIHFRPLLRILRSLTGAGFLDTDPLCGSHPSAVEGDSDGGDMEVCARHVFSYFAALPTFSQVIPVAACTGTHAMYEKMQERYGGSNSSLGLTYVNLRPIKLPGGSTLPVKTCGKLLSDEDRDFIVVAWEHPHSGWKVVLEMLTDYVNRRRMYSASNQEYHQEVSFARRGASQAIALSLEDTGVEMDPAGDEIIATDALDLVRSVIQNNFSLAKELLDSLALGEPVVAHTMTEASAPDLVQLTTMIIEEALSRSVAHSQSSTRIPLITSAMGVLSALLEVPRYSDRVWLYIRSTSALFGSDRSAGFASVALAAERTTGHYTMTMALLHLVQQLFIEASTSILQVQMYTVSLQRVKEEVLLRAAKFVHSEIWVEHLGWKYVQFGDRFVIGRRAALFFVAVVAHFPPPGSAQPNREDRPFATLCEAIGDAFLYKATTSTINPLVSSIANGGAMLKMLQDSRRYADCGKLRGMLIANLMLARLLLNHKQQSPIANKPSLLEQALCTEVTGGGPLGDSKLKVDPIDVVAGYMKQKSIGDNVKLEAMRMLHSLCASLSSSQSSPPTIVGHLSDPEATVASLVGITQHPYDELALRAAVWNFMSLAVDKEPVLARLLVTGQFALPSELMGKGITADRDQAATARENGSKHQHSAVNVAKSMLGAYKALWEYNPSLLASLLRFMDVVWQHGAEHKTALDPIRKDPSFWAQLADIVGSKLGDVPNYTVRTYESVDGIRRADLHQAVSNYAYRAAAKSFALHLIALDVGISLQQAPSAGKQPVASSTKPLGFTKVEPLFRSNFPLTDLVLEAAASSYDPGLHSGFLEYVKAEFPTLTMQQLEVQDPLTERELGDEFTFSTATLRMRLLLLRTEGGIGRLVDDADKRLRSINLNLSLAHAQTALGEAWQFFLREVVPFVRRDAVARPIVLSISASLSSNLAHEARTGDVMATMHGTRLSLLLSLLEVAWFSTADSAPELKSFITLVDNVHGIILNEPHPPLKSILGNVTVPFHRTVLQIIYFCAKHCRNLAARPKTLGAEHRLTIGTMVDATLNFTIDGLRVVFEAATTRADVELDKDQELLVAVFEQCTRLDINPSSNFWLTRCIETDVIKASLRLFACADLVGLSDRNLLLTRKHTLYVPHVLTFHMALARVPAAAEKLASEGLLNAYSDNGISEAISAGLIDVVLPELPGERSPAHRAYCSMLAIVAVVIGGLGRHNHYFDIEISGFVQLYGDQIMRALSWTIDDSITLPLVEEIEQVVNVFAAMAESAPKSAKPDLTIAKLLRTFNACALLLLQQFNYALTHPHHLASLLEPVTPDERAQVEKSAGEQDVLKRPLTVRLIDRVFVLSSAILSALITISRAESVLIGPQDDWPVQSALLIPHSKVVVGEPASLGTLVELGNCTLDRLRDLSAVPATEKTTAAHRNRKAAARRNLEGIMVYSVTQLAMWISKSKFDASGNGNGDMEVEPPSTAESQRGDNEQRKSAKATPLAEQLRRGMTGEIADDLEALLKKAKTALEEGATVDPKQNLALVLSNFLKEHLTN